MFRMLQSKTLLLFLLKAVIIYTVLCAPISYYDRAYGVFYRSIAGFTFETFNGTGFAMFREMDDPAMTHLLIGNYALVKPDKTTVTLERFINTRYLGFIPTILLVSLVLASPVPWKRRAVALAAGFLVITLLVIFKQWIALLWHSEQNSWLQLSTFTGFREKLFKYSYHIICVSSSTLLYFVVAVWLLVTFRVDDFTGSKEKTIR